MEKIKDLARIDLFQEILVHEERPSYGFFSDEYFLLGTLVIDVMSLKVISDLREDISDVRADCIVEILSPRRNILIIWDKTHTSIKTLRIVDTDPMFFHLEVHGETNTHAHPPQLLDNPFITWYDATSDRINQMSKITSQGRYCFYSMSLRCTKQNCDIFDIQTFSNQTVASHHKFEVCLQPIYLEPFLDVIFGVFYPHLHQLQICICNLDHDVENDLWLHEIDFLDIPDVYHFSDVYAGPGSQMLVRLFDSEREMIHIYDLDEDLKCIGKINLSDIPHFHKVYPINCWSDADLDLTYCSYFFSTFLEFSNNESEDLNLVRCQQIHNILEDLPSDENNATFQYDILPFPTSRYMSPKEIAEKWKSLLMKNLSYLTQAQIPKSFCIVKSKSENGGTKYKIQIKTLPNCMK